MQKLKFGLSLILTASALALAGCANLGLKPPTKLESKLFDVQTNVVQNVTWSTNLVTVTNTVTLTNAAGVVSSAPVITATPVVLQTTNFQTNYAFTPGQTAATASGVAGAAGGLFGWGGLASTAVAGLFSLYAGIRSKQSNQVAGALTQGIEVAKSVMAQVPGGGQKLVDSFTARLAKNQQTLGIAGDVAGLIDKYVDPETADAHATKVVTNAGLPASPTA